MVINTIVGVYIPIIRIPIKGGMTIPNIATFDHGTYRMGGMGHGDFSISVVHPEVFFFCVTLPEHFH